MAISAVSSGAPAAAPIAVPRENEAAERVPDNEAAEAAPRNSLQEYQGTKIDVSA